MEGRTSAALFLSMTWLKALLSELEHLPHHT